MSPLGVGTIGSVPSLQSITVRSVDGRYVLTGIAGPEPAEITDGRGGWEEVARNRKPAITQWI